MFLPTSVGLGTVTGTRSSFPEASFPVYYTSEPFRITSLGADLALGGITFPRTPGATVPDFTGICATHVSILTSDSYTQNVLLPCTATASIVSVGAFPQPFTALHRSPSALLRCF